MSDHKNPSPPLENSPPLIDPKVLRSIRDLTEPGESDFLDELIQLFIDRSPTIIQDIREAASQRDYVKMSRSAHSLKGSCGNLGIRRLMACCEKIETLGTQGRIDEAASLLEELDQTYQHSTRELVNWKSKDQ